jgi:hypothetical protein
MDAQGLFEGFLAAMCAGSAFKVIRRAGNRANVIQFPPRERRTISWA